MKKLIPLILTLLPFFLSGQTGKGAIPLNPQSDVPNPQSTRAVVIGISDYQDEQIPDLRFADRDAEAFAQWLRSPAGGSLPDNQIKVLTNKNATTGKMIAALDGLIVASKPGDEAIIYFSGHGDVERVTKFQRGFLLTYDSPPAVYAAGAFSLQYLQDIVTTLSEAGVQAVVITDACRAGKLAGSEFGGSKATSAALAQQFANEVKILSCQPEEFSLEGEQWGGGRGCFSYHLVDALYGMADANADGTVNLLELGRYLEEKVPAETAPHSQIPFTVGSKAAQIASVDTEALAQWRQQKNGEAMAFKKIDSRGLEDLALAKADTGILEMYHAFTAALDAGNLMATDSAARKSADDYYKLLIQEPSIAELHGLMTRNFAAALMDEGQQIINLLLKTDPQTLDNLEISGRINYDSINLKLERASELLGEGHYVFKSLKAKAHYFKAKWIERKINYGTPPDSPDILLQKQTLMAGLAYDSEAPYLLLNLVQFPLGVFFQSDSLQILANKLDSIAPNWSLGHDEIAGTYFSKFWRQEIKAEELDFAINHCLKAMKSDPNFIESYKRLAWLYECIGEYNESDKYRSLYVQKMKEKLTSNQTPNYAFEMHGLGNSLWRLRRYKEALEAMNRANELASGNRQDVIPSIVLLKTNLGKFEEAVSYNWPITQGDIYFYYLNDIEKAENEYRNIEDWLGLYLVFLKKGRLEQAAIYLDSALVESPEEQELLFWSGNLYERLGKLSLAQHQFEKVVKFDKFEYLTYSLWLKAKTIQMIAFHRLSDQSALKLAMDEFNVSFNHDGWYCFNLACFYSMVNEPEKALAQLKKAEELGWVPNPALWIYGTVKDPLLDPLRSLPAFQAWEQRWSPPYKDYSKD